MLKFISISGILKKLRKERIFRYKKARKIERRESQKNNKEKTKNGKKNLEKAKKFKKEN